MKGFWKRNRGKIVAAALIVVVLCVAWAQGGRYFVPDAAALPEVSTTQVAVVETTAPPTDNVVVDETAEPTAVAETPAAEEAAVTELPAAETPEATAVVVVAEKDKYLTEPVPEGKPTPVEPQEAVVGDGSFTVTLSVRCDTLLDNMEALDKEKHELVPEDGVIFATTTVTVYEGESVFNVLQRELRRAKIHMEFVNTPIYNSAYIEGINNLYEFDGGELSGWMYKVNGWFPNYGCSRYLLQPNDIIEWVYTCDLGRDVGGFYATGGS